jgi:uncharacterized protein (TIGR03086 family)
MIFAVLDDLARVAADTGPAQTSLPTPCEGFDVLTLRRHLTGGLAYFEAAFRDPDAEDRGADPHAYAGPDRLEAVVPALIATLRSGLDAGLATDTVTVVELGGVFPGGHVVDLLLIETLTHGWDLARALGRPWQPAENTCLHALAVYQDVIRPEFRGDGMPFAPEFPVRPDAPAMDRLVAFAGRDPGWTPKR